ncbi:hypothetical protein ACWGJX_43025 [Streptomyces sp. NPDC054775]
MDSSGMPGPSLSRTFAERNDQRARQLAAPAQAARAALAQDDSLRQAKASLIEQGDKAERKLNWLLRGRLADAIRDRALLPNPNDIHAWHQRDDELRRQRDEQREKERQEAASAWSRRPAKSPDAPGSASQGTREPHVANVPEPAPCEGCGLPVTGRPGILYDDPLPDDGCHCPECRTDLAQQPPGLFQALFGRSLRTGADGS